MDSIHITITLISLGLAVTSGVAWKAWLKHKERIHDIDTRVLLLDLEKLKIGLFSEAKRKAPETKVIQAGESFGMGGGFVC